MAQRATLVALGFLLFSGIWDAKILLASGEEPVDLYSLEHWINIRVIQRLVHHASGVIAALLMFWLVGLLIQRLLHEGPIKKYVMMFDQLVLLGLFVFFAWELFSHF